MKQVVHIGQRKTGTTTLQRALRRAHEGGVEFLHGKETVKDWGKTRKPATCSKEDYRELEDILRTGRGHHAIFSWEGFAAYPPDEVAGVISRALPDATVVMTTRSPDSYLRSQYKHDSQNGGILEPPEFSVLTTRNHMFKTHNLKGFKTAFEAVGFGERLCLLPYELQRDDPGRYWAIMTDILGIDIAPWLPSYPVNKAPPPNLLELGRRVNALLAEVAPHLVKHPDVELLRRLAYMMAPRVEDVDESIKRRLEPYAVDLSQLKVPDELWPKIESRIAPLATLDLYQPFLEEYRLAYRAA